MRRVIKFGGTALRTPELLREAARHVTRLVGYGEQVAVIVSAPGSATSDLLEMINAASSNEAAYATSCNFAALGEEQSVHLMVAALRSMETSAQPFLPRDTDSWPIIADSDDSSPLSTQKINEERPFKLRTQQTVSRFGRFILPQLRVGTVPVISGFFAVDSAGRVVSLGRGGSDITAFIVAAQINADEVDIVTDVQGVLAADPRLAENPRLLEELSADDLEAISGAGARVLHPRALAFMRSDMRVRLLDYRELEKLEEAGTSILGRSQVQLLRTDDELSSLTIIGGMDELELQPAQMLDWLAKFAKQSVAISMLPRFNSYFLPSRVAEQAYTWLHDNLGADSESMRNLSMRGGLGEVRLRCGKFIDMPGVIAEIGSVLANAKINITEVISSLTDVHVFVDTADLDRAENLLRRVLERYAE